MEKEGDQAARPAGRPADRPGRDSCAALPAITSHVPVAWLSPALVLVCSRLHEQERANVRPFEQQARLGGPLISRIMSRCRTPVSHVQEIAVAPRGAAPSATERDGRMARAHDDESSPTPFAPPVPFRRPSAFSLLFSPRR